MSARIVGSGREAGSALVAVVLLMGLVLVQPWIAAVWSVSGDRWYDQAATPLAFFALIGALLVAVLVGWADPWLGAFCGYVVLSAYLRPTLLGMAALEYVIAGAVLLLVVRHLARTGLALPWFGTQWFVNVVQLLVLALVASGVFQVAYTLGQFAGYDPLWFGAEARADLRPMGTIRSAPLLGAYLAMLAPLAPAVLMPVLALGVLASQSLLALLALVLGLLVRYRHRLLPAAAILGGTLGTGAIMLAFRPDLLSVGYRWTMWRLSVIDWLATPPTILFGHGFGAWGGRLGPQYVAAMGPGEHRMPLHAHNELIQFAHEGGLVALGLLVAWLWIHRGAWRSPFSGALTALAVTTLGTFPFHLATTAAAGVVILGLATAPEPA